jgi:hypothetical protein
MNDKRITVYTPSSVLKEKYRTRLIDAALLPKSGIFLTKEEAIKVQEQRESAALEKYKKHKNRAEEVLKLIEAEVNEVLVKYDASLDFFYEGDSHGVYDERLELEIILEGNTYTRVFS